MEREHGEPADVGDTHKGFVAVGSNRCRQGCVGARDGYVCQPPPDCDGIIWIKAATYSVPAPDLSQLPRQTDPNGIDPHAPGAKLDAGKDEYDMVLFSFPNALATVDKVGKFGAKKYTEGGFLEVPNGQRRYFNAGQRHGIKDRRGELKDDESGYLHKAHKAWCALAELELFLQGKGAPE